MAESVNMEKEIEKTNVMRILDAAGVHYTPYAYSTDVTDGMTIAERLEKEPYSVFKTLVTRSDKGAFYVFDVPVCMTLNLKKAAKAVGAKSIEMIKQKELLPLTGYIHGGCSPIGMKKAFPTVIDDTANLFEEICVSAGRVGRQVQLSPTELAELCGAKFADIADDVD